MLFFHAVIVLCNALFTFFDKLLYYSKKKVVLFVEARDARPPSPFRPSEVLVPAALPQEYQH